MSVWLGLFQYRRIWIILGVTIAHAMTLAWLMSQVFEPTSFPRMEAIEIELAELRPDDPPPLRSAQPIRPILPADDPIPPTPSPLDLEPDLAFVPPPVDPEPSPTRASEPIPSSPLQAAPREILTQNETAPDGVLAEIAQSLLTPGPAQSGSDTRVTPGQLATVIAQSECLELKRQSEATDCPATDPFVAAMANAKRAIPPERLFADPRYIAKTVSDKLFEAEAANRFLWPDSDLFADPLSPGANNARRIRNGQEPLWSPEMRDGFRKPD